MNLREHIKELYLLVFSCWIILAIIFGLTDLEISIALVNRESIWANIGKYYGEGAGFGIIAMALAILIGKSKDDIKKQRFASYIIILIGVIFLIMAIIFSSIWFITFGGGIVLVMLIFLILTRNEDLNQYKTIATVIIMLAMHF